MWQNGSLVRGWNDRTPLAALVASPPGACAVGESSVIRLHPPSTFRRRINSDGEGERQQNGRTLGIRGLPATRRRLCRRSACPPAARLTRTEPRGDTGCLMPGERIVPQPEVIRAILLEDIVHVVWGGGAPSSTM